MFKYAIVDDDQVFVSVVSSLIRNEIIQTEGIYQFNDPIEFLDAYKTNMYDVVFLDIDMPKLNGFEVSRKLRQMNRNVLIVFITSTETPIDKSLEFRPIGFIRKSKIEQSFQEVLNVIRVELNSINKYLYLSNSEVCYKIRFIDIIVVQSNGNNIEIFTDKEKFKFRRTLKSIKTELEFNGFVCINKGIYVNISKIKYISYGELIIKMVNDTQFPISRVKIKKIKEVIANVI